MNTPETPCPHEWQLVDESYYYWGRMEILKFYYCPLCGEHCDNLPPKEPECSSSPCS